jgi:glycerol-3-phosphate dehydrogenase
MWKHEWRDEIWAKLGSPWDLMVIGGGITGAGILREASRAGLRALLLEAHDFASGTSSRSSKMVHGGLRYLRNGQVNLTSSPFGSVSAAGRAGTGHILGPTHGLVQGRPHAIVGLRHRAHGVTSWR